MENNKEVAQQYRDKWMRDENFAAHVFATQMNVLLSWGFKVYVRAGGKKIEVERFEFKPGGGFIMASAVDKAEGPMGFSRLGGHEFTVEYPELEGYKRK